MLSDVECWQPFSFWWATDETVCKVWVSFSRAENGSDLKFGKCFDFVDGIGILEGETWTEVGTASTGCLPSLSTASASGGLLVKGEMPVLANGDGWGSFSGLLGSLGGVFQLKLVSGIQNKQEICVSSGQALSWSVQSTLSVSRLWLCCLSKLRTRPQNTALQVNHLQQPFSVGNTTPSTHLLSVFLPVIDSALWADSQLYTVHTQQPSSLQHGGCWLQYTAYYTISFLHVVITWFN